MKVSKNRTVWEGTWQETGKGSRVVEEKQKNSVNAIWYMGIGCGVSLPLLFVDTLTPLRLVGFCGLQWVTLCTAFLWFRALGEGAGVFWGTLLYLTLPWRLHVCEQEQDVAVLLMWALLPLLCLAIHQIARRERLLTAVALFLGVAAALVLLLLRVLRRGEVVPGSIALKGYSIGGLFGFYTYRAGRPGMGVALFLCLAAGLWLWFVKREAVWDSVCRRYLFLALLCTLLSLRYFPWDLVQRLGEPWNLAVSRLQTPACFFALAQIALCVPAQRALTVFDEKEPEWLAFVLRSMVVFLGMGYCFYRMFRF